MHKKTIHDILAELIAKEGSSPTEIARKTGLVQSSVQRIVKRSTKSPKDDVVKPLADYFGITPDQLRGYQPLPDKWLTMRGANEKSAHGEQVDAPALSHASNVEGIPAAIKDGMVPVVGMAQLGSNGYFEALDYPVGHGDGYVRIFSDDPNAYALKVIGDSMEPRIRSGEFVLIEPNKTFMAGDEVLVKTMDGQSMIKVFMYRRDGEVRLLSVNDSHPPITLLDEAIDKIHPVGAILKSSRFVEL